MKEVNFFTFAANETLITVLLHLLEANIRNL